MPGLVGLISRMPRAEAERQVRTMLGALHQEDFYESGVWIDEALGLYVGWTVPRGSFADGMPLRNPERDIHLLFSGEDYSDIRLDRRLRDSGDDTPECAYLATQYQEARPFVESLNGMFHAVVADRRLGEVTLFNDRYGMHRLCYHESRDGFYFGSQAKAILAARPELRRLDYRALGEFASYACVLEDRTIFENVHVLPAASIWTFRDARLADKVKYFNPSDWEQQEPLDAETYYQELRATVAKCLPRYFAGRQKMGLAITGGFDTRVILACCPPSPGALPCYTFGGPYRESQDVLIGRRIAGLCNQSHQVIEVGQEFLNGYAAYAQRTIELTEGTVDLTRADYYLSVKARQIAPAKIVGTYGSEIVRHAVMFKPSAPTPGLYAPDFASSVHAAAGTFATARTRHPVTFAAFCQSPWYHHGVLALEKSQLSVHSPFMDNDFVRTVYRAPVGDTTDVRMRLIRDSSPTLANVRSDRGLGGDAGRVRTAILNAVLEFTFKAEYAYDYGMPQIVARADHVIAPLHLERLFLGRHKFLHFRVWYRDQLAGYVREMLLDPKSLSRPYLRRQGVEAIVRDHLERGYNYTTEIHRLLSLELLHRAFADPA